MTDPNDTSSAFSQSTPSAGSEIVRAMPHALPQEKSVLCKMLTDPEEGIPLVIEHRLAAAHFYLPAHALLFDAIVRRYDSGQPVELVSLVQHLLDNGLLDRCGGPSAIADLHSYSVGNPSIVHHIRTLRDKRKLRDLIALGTDTINEAYDAPETAAELLETVDARLIAIRDADTPSENMHGAKSLAVLLAADAERCLRGVPPERGIPTGFEELDRMTGGLRKGEMFVVAARPSMGKTAFMANIVETAAIDCGHNVFVLSCEMTAKQVASRIAYSRARVRISDLVAAAGEVSRGEVAKLKSAILALAQARLTVDDTAAATITELRAKARRMHRKDPLGLIAVDYLQLMRSGSRQAQNSREREIGEISNGLKALAKELGVPVLVLAQLNRESEKRGGGRDGAKKGVPRMSDLRESGNIEQDADVIGLLHRDAYFAESDDEKKESAGAAKLIVAKNRNGPTGDVPLTFIADLMRFESGAPVRMEPPPSHHQQSRFDQ